MTAQSLIGAETGRAQADDRLIAEFRHAARSAHLQPRTRPIYGRLAIVGCGLIGSSIARRARASRLVSEIVVADCNALVRERAKVLGLADSVAQDAGEAVTGADLVIIAVPVLSYDAVAASIAPFLKRGATVSDVGSVKSSVSQTLRQRLPEWVFTIPAHPIAGTERSGPDAGSADLFENRWSILTPAGHPDPAYLTAVRSLAAFWIGLGSRVEVMHAEHHDLVLGVTSHLPHLISFNIVGMAADLEQITRSEILAYSAGGFREFTRLACSNPPMWRDICIANKDAILHVLGRFTEDLQAMSRAIRWEDGDKLLSLFEKSSEMAVSERSTNAAAPAPLGYEAQPARKPLLEG